MERLTKQEEEVMKRIWEIGPCRVREIRAKFEAPQPPYTTLSSTAKNLVRKQYVKAERRGNTYWYKPRVQPEAYKEAFMGRVASTLFGGSYKEMVSFFVRKREISADELKEILAMIEKGEE